MDDISIALLFLFAIGIITLIGHGIWVLVAAIFRAIFREPDAERAAVDNGGGANQSGDALRGMRLVFARRRQLCHLCGLSRSSAGPMADLAKTARQLDKFLNQGKLDAETHKQVMSLVEEERARLIAHVRREPTTTRREAEPRPPQPVPVEPAGPRRRPSPSKSSSLKTMS